MVLSYMITGTETGGSPDVSSSTNMTISALRDLVGRQSYDAAAICSNDGTSPVFRPVIEAGLSAFMKTCTVEDEVILSSDWSLCSSTDTFDCGDLLSYTFRCKSCECFKTRVVSPTESPDGGSDFMKGVMEDPAGVALLVGLVLIGILIGVATTVAVCLICPSVHRWANSKIRTEKVKETVSYKNSPYDDIDEKQCQAYLTLRTVSSSSRSSHSTLSPQVSNEFRPLPPARDPPDIPDAGGRMLALHPDSLPPVRIARFPATDYDLYNGSVWRNKFKDYS